MNNPKFTDAQAQHRATPKTFYVPSNGQLKRLAPGHFVKVCTAGERFWVRITQVNGAKLYGTVSNVPANTAQHGLSQHSPVEFEKRHVFSIHQNEIA